MVIGLGRTGSSTSEDCMNKPQSTVAAVVERLTDLAPPGWSGLVLEGETTQGEEDDRMAGMAILAVERDGIELRRSEIVYDWTLVQCIDCLYWLKAEVDD